jgi:exodeoxyribonuclease V alpha subunit
MIDNNNVLEVILKPERKKYYSLDSSFGIYAVIIKECDDWSKIECDNYGDVVIKGNMPMLDFNSLYVATLEPKKDPRYGMGYEVKTIYSKPITTVEEQKKFLLSILTEKQVENIFEAYPNENIIELIKNDKFDYNIVKNIGEKTYEKIKEKIIENEKYQKAIITLTGKFGVPYNAVKKMSEYYGSPDLLLQKIEENPYILTEIDGYGFKKADEIALKLGVKKTSPYRINACIEHVLEEQANDGHCWVKRTKIVNEVINLLNVKISDIEEVMQLENDRYTVENEIVYLNKYFYYESEISKHLIRLLNEEVHYKIENLDDIIKQVEEKQGFKFTEEQLRAIHLSASRNVVIINGKAGTGKTSVIKGIVEIHKTIEGLGYATCALSGKASQRIQESTGLESYTIHRLLGYNPYNGFAYNEFDPLPYDIIILDEASMVNSYLFFCLVRAIKNGAKLIITGDTAQLEPIGVGNVLVDLLESGKVPSVELTIVHRQAQKSGILSCANMVRDGKKFLSNNDYTKKRLGELKDLYVYPYEDKEKVYKAVLSIAKQYNGDLLDFQIVVPMKSRGKLSTKTLNNELQKIFNQDPKDVDSRRKIEKKNVTFLEEDKVIINGNNYGKGVFNGTIGIIKYIDSTFVKDGDVVGEIVIEFEGVGNITFTKEEMNQLDLAYAITCHKSQGSQWRYVVFAIDYSSYVLLNRQLTYTAMTRAREALFMPVELKALQHSIDTDKSSKRCTFLQQLLS